MPCLLTCSIAVFWIFCFCMQMYRDGNQKHIILVKCSIQEDVTVTNSTCQKVTGTSIDLFQWQDPSTLQNPSWLVNLVKLISVFSYFNAL